jgi:single-strand selective monofunctional uracil DNA glycosylase
MRALIAISRRLGRSVSELEFAAPVTHVYNPLVYARAPHERYLTRFARPTCEVLLVGMNPGPWGMSQTGVPFGEVATVREWMGIAGAVGRPDPEHARRPIEGFACARSEVSGRRLWGWARSRYETPERFFARFFVWNYCPLVFLEESGRNRTPDKLPRSECDPLFALCDDALRDVADALAPRFVVGIGKFAEGRARAVFGDARRVGSMLHPSPASPLANAGWEERAERDLAALGVRL